jgi:uncharacterized membrane protein
MLTFPQERIDNFQRDRFDVVAVEWAPPTVPTVEFYLFHSLWKTCAKAARIATEE